VVSKIAVGSPEAAVVAAGLFADSGFVDGVAWVQATKTDDKIVRMTPIN
jgi:hypothetical protein